MRKILTGLFGAAALLALGAGPALANKANDTLTIGVHDWWSTLDPYQFPLDEANVFYTITYETLIGYDERAHKIAAAARQGLAAGRRQDGRIRICATMSLP